MPTPDLKRTYLDVKAIINDNQLSKEAKLGLVRPLIEAFVNQENNVVENNDIRKSIKNLNNEELEKVLHKIVDDTLKGVHIKMIPLNNNPEDVLLLLEALFTKRYVIPIEEEKLRKEFEKRKLDIEDLLNQRILLIKKLIIFLQ
ncbi:hypothetical protein ABSA28_01197 [Candidatus Hepatincolaceae symbiont of Richtersius coronifer]